MFAVAGFLIGLFLSYQLFDEEYSYGGATAGTIGMRIVFTFAVAALGGWIDSRRRRARQERDEQQRAADVAAARAKKEEDERRRATSEAATARIEQDKLTAKWDAAREYARSCEARAREYSASAADSELYGTHYAFGVVSDEILARTVWDSLDTPDEQRTVVTAEQMASLTGHLELRSEHIADLRGIEHAKNLESLGLHLLTRVSDLRPLQALSNLRALSLHGWMDGMPALRGLEELTGLAGLEKLVLGRLDSVDDLRPLVCLNRLKTLVLHEMNATVDLEYLGALASLEDVRIASPRGKSSAFDPAPLRHIQGLRALRLESVGAVQSFSPLSGLDRLTTLSLERLFLDASASLATLTKLEELEVIRVGGIKNLRPLSKLSRLETLCLAGWFDDDPIPVTVTSADLGPLAELVELRDLSISTRLVESFQPLSHLTAVRTLAINTEDSLEEEDLVAISRMAHLQQLSLGVAGAKGLEALRNLNSLKVVVLNVSWLSGVGGLAQASSIEELTLRGEFLEGWPWIDDLEKLAELRRLKSLELEGWKIWNLMQKVSRISSLESLTLSKIDIDEPADLSTLVALRNLRSLSLSDIYKLGGSTAVLGELPRLEELNLGFPYYDWDTSELDASPDVVVKKARRPVY